MMTIVDTCHSNLLTIASTYAKATGVSLSQVSKQTYKNGTFFRDLKSGKQGLSVKKLDEIVGWFDRNWPDDVPWPFLPAIVMTRRHKRQGK